MIRILLADEHLVVREGIRRILEDHKLRVVAECGNNDEIRKEMRHHHADIVVMDPGTRSDAPQVVRQLVRDRKATARVIILVREPDDFQAARLLQAGASGYLTKNNSPQELLEAIRAVQKGARYIARTVREALALRMVQGIDSDPVKAVTPREGEVLRRIACGMPNREIAKELDISVKTVDAHRLNLLAKLGIRNNSELTRFAIKHNLVTAR